MDDSKKKISFIINPISGTQGKEQILKWLDEKKKLLPLLLSAETELLMK